jgi:hypothetical protein
MISRTSPPSSAPLAIWLRLRLSDGAIDGPYRSKTAAKLAGWKIVGPYTLDFAEQVRLGLLKPTPKQLAARRRLVRENDVKVSPKEAAEIRTSWVA